MSDEVHSVPTSPSYNSPPPVRSPSSHEQYIKEIEEKMNNNASENTIKNLFHQLTTKGTAKDLQVIVEVSKKRFPSLITTTILKELFMISCDEKNYEKMDYFFSLLGANEIDEITLNHILVYTIKYPKIAIHSVTLKLLTYLEDKGVDLKNKISKNVALELLYWSLKDSSYGKILIEEKEQFEVIKYLLNNFIVDLKDVKINGGESIMKYVLKSRNLKLIKYFVSMEIDDINQHFNGKNGLYFNLQNNWRDNNKDQEKSIFKVVKYLVEKGVNIHASDENGVNILHLSAQFHSLKMIKYLISLGVDLHSLDHQNNNTLLCAFKRNPSAKKKDETTEEYSARYSKIKKKNIKIIKYLISEGINVEQINDEGMDAFLYSIKWGNFELIKFIADLIPSLKTQQTYEKGVKDAIYHSLKSFNIKIFKYLDQFPFFADYFDGRNEITSKNYMLFYLIIWYNLKHGKDFKKFKEVFDFFLNKRNNINSINSSKYIPLQHFVFLRGNTWKLFNYLIEKGSDLHHLSPNGSILHLCIRRNNIDYAKYFIIRSLEINTHNISTINENNNLKFEENNFQKRKVARINNKEVHDNHLNNNNDDKDENNNNEKRIYWKREFINNVIKAPKILEYKDRNNLQVKLDSNNELHLDER